MQINVLEYLENTIKTHPDKIAFTDGKYVLSFLQISDRAKAIGTFLGSKGLRNKPIAVCMKKSPDNFAALLGVLYGGCCYVPFDTDTPPHRIKMIFETISPEVVICDSIMYEQLMREELMYKQLKELKLQFSLYEYNEMIRTEVDECLLDNIRSNVIDIDPAYIVFTSGSTGVPKGVVCSHRSLIDYIENISQVLKYDSDTVFGNQAPLTFDASLKDIYPTLKHGATTHVIPKNLFSFPIKLIEYLIEHNINTINWVGSLLATVSGCGAFDEIIPKQLRLVNNGGEVFPMTEFLKWRVALPNTMFVNTYGPTEITGSVCYYIAKRELSADEALPIGSSYRNSEVFLLDGNNLVTASENIGEICVKGASLALGYWGDFELTNKLFVQNPLNNDFTELIYRTGDLGKYNKHGELVFISRSDNQIKHMGHRIELGEIEAVVNKLDGVETVCCVYVKTRARIMLYYTGEAASDDVTDYIENALPRYMRPGGILRLEEMPKNASGKIDRNTLCDKAQCEGRKRRRAKTENE
ncbi:MAG: amino acid adenylation domain-containing protein [Oscillospiraceae bacterium]|jgi:amino acid adenylation domain-containing protein|nr:amino acid adenylation domain-containing protein [Oscillospiraceae bacterium]